MRQPVAPHPNSKPTGTHILPLKSDDVGHRINNACGPLGSDPVGMSTGGPDIHAATLAAPGH
jgi:hypothetical protein